MKHIIILIFMGCFSTVILAETLPDESIYHIGSTWTDQNNDAIEIQKLSGKIQVVAFIYSYCEHSCPIIMERLKKIEQNLTAANQQEVHFSLFSLDPKRDTPEKLKAFEIKHALNDDHWRFYNGDPDQVLELAALVNVRYKPMNNENNDIAHSNTITLLDQQGRIAHQVKGFGEDLNTVLNVINELSSDNETQFD